MLDKAKHKSGRRLPYLRNINVRWGSFDLGDLAEMYFEDDELDRYGLQLGDVLICEGGEPGRAAVWSEPLIGLLFQKALHRVRPLPVMLPQWLVHSLRRDAVEGRLSQFFTGTTIKHLTGSSLASYSLCVPPIEEQRRITAKIEMLRARADAAGEALDAIGPLLDQFRQSVLAAAFRGDLTKAWREANPDVESASELLERIRTERRQKWQEANPKKAYVQPEPIDPTGLPDLPEGWCWAILQKLAELKGGLAKGKQNGAETKLVEVPYLRVANVQRGYLDLSEIKTITATIAEAKDLQLVEGDVLFNEGGDRDKLGRGWVWGGEIANCIHQNHVFRARIFPGASVPEFVSHYGNSERARNYFLQSGQQTTNLASINMSQLKALPLPVPPYAEQAEIVRLMTEMFVFADQAKRRDAFLVGLLQALNQSILAKAFRGELVPQDLNDEPASLLLERIRAERAAAPAPARRGRRPKPSP